MLTKSDSPITFSTTKDHIFQARDMIILPEGCPLWRAIKELFPGNRVQVVEKQVIVHHIDFGKRDIWRLSDNAIALLEHICTVAEKDLSYLWKTIIPDTYTMTYEFTYTSSEYRKREYSADGLLLLPPK